MRILLHAFVVSLFTFGASAAQAAPPGLLDFPATDPVDLKMGWDTYKARATKNVCVDATTDSAPGDQAFFTYREVNEQASLSSAFNSSVSAKVQMAVGGGGGSVSFSRDYNLSTTGLNIAVQYLVMHGPSFVIPAAAARAQPGRNADASLAAPMTGGTSVMLFPKYKRLAKNNPLEFRRQCGDSFVSVITYSSGIEGLLVAATRTETEKTSVSGSFNASYLTASANGSVSSTISKMASENRLSLTYRKLGVPGVPAPTSAQGFRDLIQQVGKEAKADTSVPTHMVLTPYDELSNYPRASKPADALNAIADQYLRLLTIYRYVTDATTNPSKYWYEGNVTPNSVVELEGEMLKDLRLLGAALVDCGTIPPKGSRRRPKCEFPNVPRTDWTYRARMPLSKDAAYAYDHREELRAQIPSWAAQRGPVQTDRYRCGRSGINFCYKPNPTWAYFQDKIDEANKFIAENGGALNHKDQRYQVFIADPRKLRCDQLQSDCISQAEADQIKAGM
jgi:hypothetical protein